MKLTALRLYNVRRFANRGVALEGIGEGVNVLCAHNEFGKSTCFDALHALFFEPHTGTPNPVKALRPYSGGSPVVEAEIETETGRFRLAKQYYGGRSARVFDLDTDRLLAQADEAEAFISDRVHGGTGGPAGLLWVRQGITGVERRAKADEDAEKRARETVLTSVQGEVEALTGGRRMAGIMAACEAELDRYVTATGRPRTGGAHAEAIAAYDRLAGEVQRLGAEVGDLREALDERQRVRARLAELGDDDATAARRDALKGAEAALAAARAHGEALHLKHTEAELARAQADKARGDVQAYEALLERARALDAVMQTAGTAREAARARQDASASAIAETRGALEAAEREEKEARELFLRLERALRARDAAQKREAFAHTLEKAEAAREALESGEARLRALDIPDRKFEALQACEAEIERLRAGAQASAPSLRVDYADGMSGAITIAGEPLGAGEPRTLSGTIQLDIAGVGRMTVTAPVAPGSEAVAQAVKRRDDMLAELEISSLAEGIRRRDAASALKGELALERERLNIHAPEGLPALRETVARLNAADTTEVPQGDPDALRGRHTAAEGALETLRNRVRALEPGKLEADKAVLAAERDWAVSSRDRDTLDETLGPAPDREARLETLRRADAAARAPYEQARAEHEALAASAPDLASAEASVTRLRSALDAASKEAAGLRERLATLDERIRTRSEDAVEEAWREAEEELRAAASERDRLAHEVNVLTVLRDTLAAARSEAREHYFEPVMRELKPLLALMFDDAEVTFDETTLTPRTVARNGQIEDIERLSGGMREQLAVMTRLAFARLLARDGRPAPVILDDALVYSDDDRIEKMFDALHRQARDQQIIVFSCRQRAFASLGGNVLSMTDWIPDT